MNWQKFVQGNLGVTTPHLVRSHSALLMSTVRELAETNTLANWVRDTNHSLVDGRQLTLAMFA
ncbi:MAG: hypothetical protein HOC95_02305 [Candidatus Diapherotrites archaeon]|nr:hypothetical protein [Candidatus Diapherotrites archaeon]